MNQLDRKWMNKILHTDCVKGMRQLPDECIPFTLTSPPYDDIREYGGHAFDFDAVAEELWRITMPGGVVVWVVGEQIKKGSETGTPAKQKLHFKDLGFRCSTMIMATSQVSFPQKVRYPSVFHYAFVLTKGRPRYVNIIRDKPNRWAGSTYKWHTREPDGTLRTQPLHVAKPIPDFGHRTNVWYYYVGGSKTTKDKINHPALMPEAMARDLILSFSRPGDLTFDCFAGGGTTCKMALLNHRRYLGMEAHGKFVLDATKRLDDARQEQKRWLDASLFGDRKTLARLSKARRNGHVNNGELHFAVGERLGEKNYEKADGEEFDESAADGIPHRRCPFCERRYPV
jgi:DNA modification methylase